MLGWVPQCFFSLGSIFFKEPRASTLKMMAEEGWTSYLKAWAAHPTKNFSEAEKRQFWNGSESIEKTENLIRGFYSTCKSPEVLDKIQQVMSQDWLVEDLLMKADKMTMANSIELRVPFLTHSFVEWAQQLPTFWRVGDKKNGYVSKRILRSFSKNRVPRSIIERPKRGFPVPAYAWLSGDLGEWAYGKLTERNSPIHQWVKIDKTKEVLEAARGGHYASAQNVWLLLILHFWAKRWL